MWRVIQTEERHSLRYKLFSSGQEFIRSKLTVGRRDYCFGAGEKAGKCTRSNAGENNYEKSRGDTNKRTARGVGALTQSL